MLGQYPIAKRNGINKTDFVEQVERHAVYRPVGLRFWETYTPHLRKLHELITMPEGFSFECPHQVANAIPHLPAPNIHVAIGPAHDFHIRGQFEASEHETQQATRFNHSASARASENARHRLRFYRSCVARSILTATTKE